MDVESFREQYHGHYDSEVDYAYQLVDDTGMLKDVPENIAGYFNYDAFARDLFLGDYYSVDAPGGGVWVFSPS